MKKLRNWLDRLKIVFLEKSLNKLLASETLLVTMSGSVNHQGLFEYLNQISLTGMNIGNGASPVSSGEVAAMNYVRQRLKATENLLIFDVGANIGYYAKLLKDVFKNSRIYSFEPAHHTYQKLLSNTKNISGLTCYNFGFGREETKIPLFSNESESALASVYNRRLEHFNIQMNVLEEIEIHTIDDFCLEENIDHIHLLKLDVEGHEMSILEGARKMIVSKRIDFIQFEFGGCNIDSKTYFQDFFYLLKDKYIIYRVLKDGLWKIDNYREVNEIFITTNYLAERIDLN